jgi:hypothetical protein
VLNVPPLVIIPPFSAPFQRSTAITFRITSDWKQKFPIHDIEHASLIKVCKLTNSTLLSCLQVCIRHALTRQIVNAERREKWWVCNIMLSYGRHAVKSERERTGGPRRRIKNFTDDE